MSFKKIFYDYKSNKIYHWFVDEDGNTRREEFHPEIEYYVNDPTGKSEIKNIYGNPVILKKAKNKYELKSIKGVIPTYETDVPEDVKFLQKRYGNQQLKVQLDKFQIATIDIEISTEKKFPKPELALYPINLISIHLSKQNQIYTFGLFPYTGDSKLVQNYHYCADEKTLITRFITFFRKCKIDVLSGWHVRGFDTKYIINRCKNLDITISMSPVNQYKEKNGNAGYHIDGGGYEICGIATLDGMDLYKNFEREKRQSYALNAIGMIEVGEGKMEFEGTIHDIWKSDWNTFVEYNIQDVLLTKKINDKKRYIELTINFCYQVLVPFEKVFSSINLATGYILRVLHKQNLVLSDKSDNVEVGELPGAFVMAKEGIYRWCMNFDVESLYPHMIILYNISPETLVLNPTDTTGLISTPIEGVYYRKDKLGIVPDVVSRIFAERKRNVYKRDICKCLDVGITDVNQIKIKTKLAEKLINELIIEIKTEGGNKNYYDSQQYIRKILANAIYGDLGNRYFVFYNLTNAKVVTTSGQALIKFLSNTINNEFRNNATQIMNDCFPDKHYDNITLEKDVVILIDTDSNFLCFEEVVEKFGIEFNNFGEFRDWCNTLNDKYFEPFFDNLIKNYFKQFNIDRGVNFRKEKMMSQMIVLAMKKYAMQIVDKEGEYFENGKLFFTGIEMVRTDTPLFCRRRLQEVVQEIFDVRDSIKVVDKMIGIYDQYMKVTDVNDIAIAKGVKDYDKYTKPIEYYIENGLQYVSRLPIQVRASMNYNYMIEKFDLPYVPIANGTKMKYFYIKPNNILHQNVIGFVSKWPEEFNEYFSIDKEMMWNKTFKATIERFFEVLQWGKIYMEKNAFDELEALCGLIE